MNTDTPDVIIIRGAPGSGKTQTAKCLSSYFPKGIRMEIDNLRSMVVSVDWTNQTEHIGILGLSAKLVCEFANLGYSPVIVVDTFSGDKIVKFIEDLCEINGGLSVQILGLYANSEELTKRIKSRSETEFRDEAICQSINNEVCTKKYNNEFQVDTTGLLPIETARQVIDYLNNINNTPSQE